MREEKKKILMLSGGKAEALSQADLCLFLYPLPPPPPPTHPLNIPSMLLFARHVQQQQVCPRNVSVPWNIILKACRDTEKTALV